MLILGFEYCGVFFFFSYLLCVRPADQWITCKEGNKRAYGQRFDQDGVCPCKSADLHQGNKHLIS